MDTPQGTTVVVHFANVEQGSVRRVLEILGLARQPDPRCRWHEPTLLTVRMGLELFSGTLEQLREVPGVKRVVQVPREGLLSTFARGASPVVVSLPNGQKIGGGGLTVIAGPCSVEGEAQVCEIAEMVRDAGADALRGGAFKPRSSPYDFGGLGVDGLVHLAAARRKTGLPVVTDVLDADDLDVVAEHADVIQIGTRSMQNFPLLFKAGKHPSRKPVLLKRGFGSTIDELLLAAEYVLLGRIVVDATEPGVILCERGIRTFEPSSRFTFDVTAIPVLKERTRLPVFADPSHPAGTRRYVPALARAATAAGADGLLMEVHSQPASSWCDPEQAMGPQAFRQLMGELRGIESLLRRRASPESAEAVRRA